MYIYCVLINTLSAHIIHINLDILYTCTDVEHSPIKNNLHKVFYGNTHTAINLNVHDTDQYHTSYMHTHTHNEYDCSRNWVLIFIGAKILWEEKGFQFGFKRRQGWTVSKALREWIPKGVQSKRRCENYESCISIVGFPICGCQKKSIVYEMACRLSQNHL